MEFLTLLTSGFVSYLKKEGPAWIVFLGDGIVKISECVVGLFTSENLRFGGIEIFDTLIALNHPKNHAHVNRDSLFLWCIRYLEMKFHPDEFILLVDHLEGM